MRIPSITLSALVFASACMGAVTRTISKDVCKSVLECNVTGDDSPEAALRQVDEHALRSMFCNTGCDYAVNKAISHAFGTKVSSICSVKKVELNVKQEKYTAKDNDESKRESQWFSRTAEIARRDINAYTVGSAKISFCCMDERGVDYTEDAAKRLNLEMSICKRL
ncbi:uncharacterized protein UHOD_05232 [Ustilago sp. UG-2017b]|nr:uncharacterized protein UHOD_05232 [Ustilago sp. UG-2017b]